MDRRVRTAWMVRQRYHRAGWIASGVGAAVGLLLAALILRLDMADGKLSGGTVLGCIVIVTAFSLLPRAVVLVVWRAKRRQHFWEWQ